MSDYSYFSYRKVGHRYSISSSTTLAKYIMLRELHKKHALLDENDPDPNVQQLLQEKMEFMAARKRKVKKQMQRNRSINNKNDVETNKSGVPTEQLQLQQCLVLPPPPSFRPPPPPYIGLIHPLSQIPCSFYTNPRICILWIGKFSNVIGASFIGHPPGSTKSMVLDKVTTVAVFTCGPATVQEVAAAVDAPALAASDTNITDDCKPFTSTTGSLVATATTFTNFGLNFFAKDEYQNNADKKKKKKQQKVKEIPTDDVAVAVAKVQHVEQ